MAANPPPVEADLSGFTEDAGAVEAATEFWRTILPWDDLIAKSPPGRHLEFQKDIIPTLAVLVAGRGAVGPKLVPADAAGRIQTTGNAFFSDQIQAPLLVGGQLVSVADTSLYSAGMFLYFPQWGAGGPGAGLDWVTRINQVATDFGKSSGVLGVNPGTPQPIPSGTPFLAIGPPSSWLPAAPWQKPVDIPSVPLVVTGPATSHFVAAIAGQRVYVYTGAVMITTAVAATEWRLQDSAGNVRWRGLATSIGQQSFDLRGAPIGPTGTGLDVNVTGGASVCTFSATTSQV